MLLLKELIFLPGAGPLAPHAVAFYNYGRKVVKLV